MTRLYFKNTVYARVLLQKQISHILFRNNKTNLFSEVKEELKMATSVVVDVSGQFACFTKPYAKVERITYDVPTPSACRGILEAIYYKPSEFYYQIKKIEVMNPIKYLSVKRNEVYLKVTDGSPINVRESNTQRNTIYLKNVRYRIHADIIKFDSCEERVTETSLANQFNRRVKSGKCFYQPFLGMKECMAFFEEADKTIQPLQESQDFGIMLYDNFDIRTTVPLNTKTHEGKIVRSFYHAEMINGVIVVPEYTSEEVWKTNA